MAENKPSGSNVRPKSSRRRVSQDRPLTAKGQQAVGANELLDDTELDQALNIRVKERDPSSSEKTSAGGGRKNSRLTQLFRDPSPAAIKESIKRPLTGLFRRTGSRSGSRPKTGKRDSHDEQQQQQQQQSQPPQQVQQSQLQSPQQNQPLQQPNQQHTAENGVPLGSGGPSASVGNGHVMMDDEELEQLGAAINSNSGAVPDTNTNAVPMAQNVSLIRDQPMPNLEGKRPPMRAFEAASESHVAPPVGRRAILKEEPMGSRTATPDIPQLDEAAVIEMGNEIAQAPSVAVNRVATYHELDSTLMKHAAFSTLENIDLSLLTRFLCTESEVNDEGVSWTWDYLFTSVCTELRDEWAMDEQEEDDYDPQGPIAGRQ